jgi:hypothetical protein
MHNVSAIRSPLESYKIFEARVEFMIIAPPRVLFSFLRRSSDLIFELLHIVFQESTRVQLVGIYASSAVILFGRREADRRYWCRPSLLGLCHALARGLSYECCGLRDERLGFEGAARSD